MPLVGFGTVFLIQLMFAAHVIRTGRSYLWLVPIVFLPLIGCVAYLVFAIIPDMLRSAPARRFADDVVSAADPGRAYREKKRKLDLVESAQAKRDLADECIKRGRFNEAIDLYQSALDAPMGRGDPALLQGLARAKLLAGDGSGAQAMFEMLKAADARAFDADAQLDYARALALQQKNDQAIQCYEELVPRYAGEEARCRYALLLLNLGQRDKADTVFRAILDSVRHAPSYYRRRQREWANIARQNLRS